MKFWVNTAVKNHIERGLAGGYSQANHGAAFGLKKLSKGDWIVHYASKISLEGSEPYQKFMAIGRVNDDELYQVQLSPEFQPFRRNIEFIESTEASIKPMLEELSFIQDLKHWGLPFRRGLFEIPEQDFQLIAGAMGISVKS